MAWEKLFSEAMLRRVLQQYVSELRVPEEAARRILCTLLKKPPP